MSLDRVLHTAVLATPGVAVVYAADPAWVGAAQRVGERVAQRVGVVGARGSAASTGVVSSLDAAGPDPVLTVRVRLGTDGTRPAPEVARAVAAALRATVAQSRAAAGDPPLRVMVAVQVAALGS